MGFEAYLAIKALIGGGAVIAAAGGAYAASARRRAAVRRMRAAPRQIDDLAVVTLIGTVTSRGEPLVAALSGKPCVAYRASASVAPGKVSPELERRRSSVDGAITVIESVLTPFTLVTETGEVVQVDGETCEIAIRPGAVIPRRLEREQAFLNRHALPVHARDGKFDEVIVAPGERIAVYGVARVDVTAADDGTYREAARAVRLVGDDKHPLTIAET